MIKRESGSIDIVDRLKAEIQFVEVYKHHVPGFTEVSKNQLLWNLREAVSEIEILRSEVKELKLLAKALIGDLKAADEEPTHYVSWFRLIEKLEGKENA